VNPFLAPRLFAAATIIANSFKVENVWQNVVILRMGKLQSIKGAVMLGVIPIIDAVIAVIDNRIQTTDFNAEQALTRNDSRVAAGADQIRFQPRVGTGMRPVAIRDTAR
jgi:regulator of protease activity HflC (stomatin/prohibitin superfamily)